MDTIAETSSVKVALPNHRGRTTFQRSTVKSDKFAQLTIRMHPDPVLRKRCAPVTQFGPRLHALISRMTDLMHGADGVGLAAPQVGVLARLFVYNATGEPADAGVIINPEFVELEGVGELEEGCLSLPGVSVTMRRATRVVLKSVGIDGEPLEMSGEDLVARVWQHEADHLDGKLIIDNMSAADEIANRYAVKQLKLDYEAVRR